MTSRSIIGIDVGGTKIHVAHIKDDSVVAELRVPTGADRAREHIIKDLVDAIGSFMSPEVIGIGIGVPGLVDMEAGVIYNVSNIPAWTNFPIKEELESFFTVPVFIGNDANCFVLGEKYFGHARGHKNVVGLTLGTGVGAGVIVNDALHVGNCSMAGEFGGIAHLDSDFENYCSGKFFLHKYKMDAYELSQKAANGDKAALDIFREYGKHVGSLIQTILYSYGPDAIIIGGSLSKAFPYFENGMLNTLDMFPHKVALETTVIEISDNPHIAVLGAGALTLSAKEAVFNP
ncbi:ROK family protein [Alkaliflexus imshenetskii]|uniref:ROK family protein n=1 Tax=Alkaliflexus imshenetskii TaxID=286730 RepID=UPI0004790DD8|nr:ROK family protein [Alkaliflexus imshenetskii]